MNELMTTSSLTHQVLLLALILTTVIVLVLFKTENDYVKLTKIHERGSLIYFLFLTTLAFTGLLAFTVLQFTFSAKIVIMILAFFHMLVTSIKLYVKFKKTTKNDLESQIEFKNYANKKYTIDIFLLIIIGFISYAIHF